MALELIDDVLETKRTGVGLDGAIEVVDEAVHAMVKPSQGEERGTPID